MSDENFLTTSQVARRLGVNEKTVRRRCERGEIPAVKGMLSTGSEGWRISPDWLGEITPDTLPDTPDNKPDAPALKPDTTPDTLQTTPDTPDSQGETTLIRASDSMPDMPDTMPDTSGSGDNTEIVSEDRVVGRREGWSLRVLVQHMESAMETKIEPLRQQNAQLQKRLEEIEASRVGQAEQLDKSLTMIVEAIEAMDARQEKLLEENQRLQRELQTAKANAQAEQSKSWWEKWRSKK